MAADWTTCIDPEQTRDYGVEELHTVCFEPVGWPGQGLSIGLLIPEGEVQYTLPATTADGDPVVVISHPRDDKSVRDLLRLVCKRATADSCFVNLVCETAEQAERAASLAGMWLPRHRRLALERLGGRARDKLS